MAKRRVKVTVDVAAAARARRYRTQHGISISRLVGEFLAQLPLEEESTAMPIDGSPQPHAADHEPC
jgi:hypothetical protein